MGIEPARKLALHTVASVGHFAHNSIMDEIEILECVNLSCFFLMLYQLVLELCLWHVLELSLITLHYISLTYDFVFSCLGCNLCVTLAPNNSPIISFGYYFCTQTGSTNSKSFAVVINEIHVAAVPLSCSDQV